MNKLLRCNIYVLEHILRLLPYNDILSLRSSCEELSIIIDNFLQHVTKIRGCWECAQEFTQKYPNVKEISLSNDNDDLGYDCDNNFSFPDTIGKIFVDKETDVEIHMTLPKHLKVFHSGGIFLDHPIECPDLEEFLCCETGASPPLYEFNNATKVKRFVMDRCGDNGENPMEFLHDSQLEILELSTVDDESLMNMRNLKHLNCGELDGTCFKNLQNLESLSFCQKDTFDAKYFSYLHKLKALHLERSYDSDYSERYINISGQLQYVNPELENLSLDLSILEKNDLLELAKFITTRFKNLVEFSMYDYGGKLKFFSDRVAELNPKIICRQHMRDFIRCSMSEPSKDAFNICKCDGQHENNANNSNDDYSDASDDSDED